MREKTTNYLYLVKPCKTHCKPDDRLERSPTWGDQGRRQIILLSDKNLKRNQFGYSHFYSPDTLTYGRIQINVENYTLLQYYRVVLMFLLFNMNSLYVCARVSMCVYVYVSLCEGRRVPMLNVWCFK